MTPADFSDAIARTRMQPDGRSTKAARLVLVDGQRQVLAASICKLSRAAVSQAVARIRAAAALREARYPAEAEAAIRAVLARYR